MSLPNDIPIISENLSASAPYWLTTSNGSTPFPNVLLIFLPNSSRTIPCIITSENGFFPRYSNPE